MKSKAEIIRDNLAGLTVLDIGGMGYEEENAYERELADAWGTCKKRVNIDYSENADITVDFNKLPLPKVEQEADVIIWDGGNNDFPFIRPDLSVLCVVVPNEKPNTWS